MAKSAKVILVGFDGATFRLADPLMRAGNMPNLSALIGRGCRAALESTTPWHSGPAWTSMVTGVSPGKHGVFNFFKMHPDLRNLPLDSSSAAAEKIWHRLNRAGFRAGVVNVPMTYPAERVDGFMVSGLPNPGADIYPPEIGQTVARCGQFADPTVPVVNDLYADPKMLVNARMFNDELRAKITVALAAMGPDFVMTVFSSTDELQHQMWHSWDPAHPAHGSIDLSWEPAVLPRVYRNVDSHLGDIVRAYAGPGTAVFVVSDHGFESARHIFFPNRVLADWGYLQPRAALPDDPLAGDQFYSPAKMGFDPGRTRAFMGPALAGPFIEIFINLKGRNPRGIVAPGAEYERLRDELSRRCLNWKDPVSGFRPVAGAHRREELYSGPCAAEAPDLLLECADCRTMSDVAADPPLQVTIPWHAPTKAQTGTHSRDGIFAAAGPGIRPGAVFDRFRIVDVAPTILHYMGLPVPDYLDGRTLEEIFSPDFRRANPVRTEASAPGLAANASGGAAHAASASEKEKMSEILKGLGYFS
jgi:predicted AlkP superfamily phosphohydrolase/phosphomutase